MTDSLRGVPWDGLSRAHLDALLDDGVPEGRTIEYKRDSYRWNDAGTREFLADVSSFANSAGGHLIVGIDEEDGVPVSMPGVSGSADDLVQLLDSKIQHGIDPRLLGVRIKAIPLDGEMIALVLRIPRSWNRPHMVTFKNLSRSFARNNAGKYQMDIHEIRTQVLGGSAVADQLQQFRKHRVGLIDRNDGPMRMPEGAKLVVHAVPFAALELGKRESLPEWNEIYQFLRPLGATGWNNRINFDGLLTYSDREDETYSYLQLFRQGMVETVNADLLQPRNQQKHLFAEYIDGRVRETVEGIQGLMQALDLSPPVAWMLTLTQVRDYEIQVQGAYPTFHRSAIDRDAIWVPEIIDVDMTLEPTTIAKDLMDPVWQAGGWPGSRTLSPKKED